MPDLCVKRNLMYIIIGIEHDFLCINIYILLDTEGGVETQSMKAEDFNDTEGSSKYLCIRKPCLIAVKACLIPILILLYYET